MSHQLSRINAATREQKNVARILHDRHELILGIRRSRAHKVCEEARDADDPVGTVFKKVITSTPNLTNKSPCRIF